MLLLIFGLSSQLEQEESARLTAEQDAAQAAEQRNEAISAANDAIARANQETVLRATAEAEQSESELLAQEETALRATAEAEQLAAEQVAQEETRLRATAEAKAQLAESEAARESRLRATAEAEAQQSERQRAADHTEAERDLALELARTSPTIQGIATGQINFYIEPLPWYAANDVDEAVDAVVARLGALRHHGASVQRTYLEFNADIYVQWVRDYGDEVLGLAIHQTVIHVGLGSTNCRGEWQAFDQQTVEEILWHELGHAFGYGHSDDPNNVMYFEGATRFAIDHEISEVIAPNWAWAFPLCSAGTFRLEFENEDSRDRFDYGVVPPGTTLDYYFDNPGVVISSCESGTDYRFRDTCSVSGIGYLVVIHNTNASDAIRLYGTIENRTPRPAVDMTWDEDAFYYDDETLDYYRELFADE